LHLFLLAEKQKLATDPQLRPTCLLCCNFPYLFIFL